MKKHYYTIGEVSNILGVKPYVIRYWESEFSFLKPRKQEGRIRKYSEDNILLLKKIKDMLYNQRFTIAGARQKLKAERAAARRGGTLPQATQPQARDEVLSTELQENLRELRGQLLEMRTQCRKLLGKEK
ncbi:MAG: MerR family transcriptional regulator [Candidatus Cloacimonetes bacterium]|nr:MerR family transcriptional regulator [Candidatus Cloacimonadota bacterium]